MLNAGTIAEANPGLYGRDIHVTARTTSTNADLLAQAKAGAPAGRVLISEEQTGGRGRLGRSWHSPAGKNIYLSLLIRPVLAHPEDLPALALVAGVAVAGAVREISSIRATVKWPNDVLVDGRKLSGILTEATDTSPIALVVGIGLNVNQISFPPELAPIATSMFLELGRGSDRNFVTAALLRHLHQRIELVEQGGLAQVLAEWTDLSATIGATVRTEEGLTGRAVAIDPSGALLISDAKGETHKIIGGLVKEVD